MGGCDCKIWQAWVEMFGDKIYYISYGTWCFLGFAFNFCPNCGAKLAAPAGKDGNDERPKA